MAAVGEAVGRAARRLVYSQYQLELNRRSFLTDCAFVDVRAQNSIFIDKLAELSYHAFRGHAPNWLPTIDAAREEVTESLQAGRHSRALVDTAQEPVGWVGVIPHSGGRVWEIHRIAVRTADQSKGYGRLLVKTCRAAGRNHTVC